MNIAAMLEPAPTMNPSTSSKQHLQSLFPAAPSFQQYHQSQYELPPLPSLPLPLSPTQRTLPRMDSGSSDMSSTIHTPVPLQHLQQQQPLQQVHQNNSDPNRDMTRRASSESSSHAGATRRSRGKQTKAACIPCRKRKSKCDGMRPTCNSCTAKSTPCNYSVNPGVTQQQAIKNQLAAYKHILVLLRSCDSAQCDALIAQLKRRDTLAEAVVDISRDLGMEVGLTDRESGGWSQYS